jgi:acetylornithine aminotransferase
VPTYNGDGVRLAEGVVFTHGRGAKLWDAAGKEYVDWAAGIAVNALGHSDPQWVESVRHQATQIAHVSNLFHTWEPLHLAKALVQSTRHFHKVFLCNSGTEANEAALKFARKYALANAVKAAAAKAGEPLPPPAYGCKGAPPTACFTRGGTCGCWPQARNNDVAAGVRDHVIAFKNSFHGRSMGALAATHKPAIRQPYAPFGGDVSFARFNSINGEAWLDGQGVGGGGGGGMMQVILRAGGMCHCADVVAAISKRTAAVIVEPVQGEGGIFPADRAFMRDLRQLTSDHGALLIVDEVQCGLGRTGRLWAHEAYDVAPDIMTLAKPLAGGLPIGATLVQDHVAAAIAPGDHGTTYGGNPFVARVAHDTLLRIADPAFLAASRARGGELIAGMRQLQARFPSVITDVRSTLDGGLFVGVQLAVAPKPITQAAAKRGLLVITAGDNVLRLCPPLNITAEEVAFGVAALGDAIQEAYGSAK